MNVNTLCTDSGFDQGLRISLGQQDQCEGDDTGEGLHEQDLSVYRQSAVAAGDDDAGEKEDFDMVSRSAEENAPDEPRGEESIVKALVRRKGL